MGFIAPEPIHEYDHCFSRKYAQGQHRYYFNATEFSWPGSASLECDCLDRLSIDAFCASTQNGLNANHLRALAYGNALASFWPGANVCGSLVMRDGSVSKEIDRFYKMLGFLGCKMNVHKDAEFVHTRLDGEYALDGKRLIENVITVDDQGRRTRARDILSFMRHNRPSHYIVSIDHAGELARVGQTNVHYLAGVDGGDAIGMFDLLDTVEESFAGRGEDAKKIAWNSIAYAMFAERRGEVLSLDVKDSQGSYLYDILERADGLSRDILTGETIELQDKDVQMLGFAAYEYYYRYLSAQKFDPYPLAKYALMLARRLDQYCESEEYHRPAFEWSIMETKMGLISAMMSLGLFVPKDT